MEIYAQRNSLTLQEASARAFALVAIANTAYKQDNKLGVIHEEPGKEPIVVGVIKEV